MAINSVGKIDVEDGSEYSRGTGATLDVCLSQARLPEELDALRSMAADELDEAFPNTTLSLLLTPIDQEGNEHEEPSDRVRIELRHNYWARQHSHGEGIHRNALMSAVRLVLDVLDEETAAAEDDKRGRWGRAMLMTYATSRLNTRYSHPWRRAQVRKKLASLFS